MPLYTGDTLILQGLVVERLPGVSGEVFSFQVLGLLPTMRTFSVGLNIIHTTKFVL